MRRQILLASLISASMMPGMAHAAADDQAQAKPPEAAQEIIVTAEHVGRSLQKTALSITALGGSDLQSRGVATINQAVFSTPSIVIQQSTNGYSPSTIIGGGGPPNIAIRGLGTDGFNKQPSVRVYQDGVLLLGGGAFFYDLDRVEVLRGPQGTLYGRGAIAGAMNIVTKRPTQENEGWAQIGVGNYGQIDAQGAINLPVTKELATRVAFNVIRHDGYFNNGQSAASEISVRGQALYTPTADVTALISATYYKNNGTAPGKVVTSAVAPYATGWNTTEPAGGVSNNKYIEVHGQLDWNLGFAKLTWIPAYESFNSHSVQYMTYLPQYQGKQIGDQPFHHLHTQELRLAGSAGILSSWQAGLFYYSEQFVYQYANLAPYTASGGGVTGYGYGTSSGTYQTYNLHSKAAFAQGTFGLTDQLRVVVGGRYSIDDVDQSYKGLHQFDAAGVDITPASNPNYYPLVKTYRHFDYRVRGEYDLGPATMLYASISTGYRPGSITVGVPFAPEEITSYEAGIKSTMLGRALTLNAAGHYSHLPLYANVQLFPVPSGGGDVRAVIYQSPVTIYGGELEATLRIGSHDRLGGNVSYNRATFDANTTVTNPFTLVTATYPTKGGSLPHAPDWKWSANYQHTFDMANGARITASGDISYQSGQMTDFNQGNYPAAIAQLYQPAFAMLNGAINYTSPGGRYQVTAYIQNATNRIYKIQANVNTNVAFVNDPRSFGVKVLAKF
jgi:iron complex outermembrane receptor protein